MTTNMPAINNLDTDELLKDDLRKVFDDKRQQAGQVLVLLYKTFLIIFLNFFEQEKICVLSIRRANVLFSPEPDEIFLN